ncbi:MAG: HAMP domain-containing protein [Chloroflexi bacterium]|nr:HAMP domain-containing protein [Chloroflexota bacterium]
MSRFWKSSSISQAILLALFCVSIIPIIGVSMVVINLSNTVLAEQMIDNLQTLVELQAKDVDTRMGQAEAAINQIAPIVIASLDSLPVTSENNNQLDQIDTLFATVLAGNPASQAILVIFADGTRYEVETGGNGRFHADTDIAAQTTYQTVASINSTDAASQWLQSPYSTANNDVKFTLTIPLLSPNGDLLAVLAQDFDLIGLYQFNADTELVTHAVYNFFTSPQGDIIPNFDHENDETFSTLTPLLTPLNIAPSALSATDTLQDQAGNDYVLISIPLQKNGWSVNAVVLADEVVPPSSPGARVRILLMMVAAVVFVVIMAALLIRTIHYPLKLLLTGVQQVSEGDHAQQVSVDSFQELNHLAHAFNKMAAKVWERETALKASVARLRIEIDMSQKNQQVESLVETDFFKELASNAARLRNKVKRE